jgi:hypothetical protein
LADFSFYLLQYADNPTATGARIVDSEGKLYATNLDNITPVEDLTLEELKELNIPEWFVN